ncbi:MAG: type pilus assembly PilZ [Myxococcaceae bacterium]|nr:type pilus assembly PilZ [Myxococcaceae bacterium]
MSKEPQGDERRESPRVPMTFLVRDVVEGGGYLEREGDLSLGGIYWKGKSPPSGTQVEVRFRLPGVPKEIRARGEIIRVMEKGPDLDFHVRFLELDVADELAMARHIENYARSH